MQGRSWMAALTLAAGLLPVAALAGDPAAPAAKTDTVALQLRIAGLGPKGCEVEIKPAHRGCRFRSVKETVKSNGVLNLELKDIETLSADRDCTFAITIREPGQAERTMYRGLQLGKPREKEKLPSLVCYLSSPSRLAKAGSTPAPKR